MLWIVSSDALCTHGAVLVLAGVAAIAIASSHRTARDFAGSLMLIGWCGLALLVWGVFGPAVWVMSVWALVAGVGSQ